VERRHDGEGADVLYVVVLGRFLTEKKRERVRREGDDEWGG
jgi:hypothetical protein